MKEQTKPSLDKHARKGKPKKSRKRGSNDNKIKARTQDSKDPKRNYRPWIVAAVVVVAISIPLLVYVAERQRTESLNLAKASPPVALPRFLDLGTTTCPPCKAMLGIMAELQQLFPGKLEVQFINVNQYPDALGQYGIKTIPAQIFYSPEGKELYRHTGVISTNDVIAQWKTLGYDLVGAGRASGGQ